MWKCGSSIVLSQQARQSYPLQNPCTKFNALPKDINFIMVYPYDPICGKVHNLSTFLLHSLVGYHLGLH